MVAISLGDGDLTSIGLCVTIDNVERPYVYGGVRTELRRLIYKCNKDTERNFDSEYIKNMAICTRVIFR